MLFETNECKYCGKQYADVLDAEYKWCESCIVLIKNFTNWTSGSEKIDYLIQQKQLEIYVDEDLLFEWIPYNKFNDIKEIGKDGSDTVYSAIWKDGPLRYEDDKYEWERKSDKKIILKYSYNSQNNIDEFLNKV